MKWEKEGKEVREALVGDEVDLVCEVKDINNGEKVKLRVWEHDEDNEHDLVAELGGVVENGKVRKGWEVIYTEDNDDSSSGKELKEKGYTLPEYHFVAEYGDVKSEPGPVLEVRCKIEKQVIDKATKEPLVNAEYLIITPTGEYLIGKTDSNGYIRHDKSIIGNYHTSIADGG